MGFTPLKDKVLIKPSEALAKSAGGIYIPESGQEKSTTGTIVAVGPGKSEYGVFIQPFVKVGQKVMYGKYAGTEIEIEGAKHMIVAEDEIIGIIS